MHKWHCLLFPTRPSFFQPSSTSPSLPPTTITFFFSFFAALSLSTSPPPPPTPCFPQFGIFPYPYPLPPSLPSPSPPPQGSNHGLPKLPKLASTPLTIPDIPSIKTTHFIPPLPHSSDHGGSKRSFCIDSSFFSFSFDGGRFDSYALHETCRGGWWHLYPFLAW